MQQPQEGDSVSFQVDAIITRVDGETAYVKPSAVNGKPLGGGDESQPEDDDAAEGAALRQTALQDEQA